MDDVLGIENLPHKMTTKCTIETAYWGQNQNSFEAAKDAIHKDMDITISKETIRRVCSQAKTSSKIFSVFSLVSNRRAERKVNFFSLLSIPPALLGVHLRLWF
jgi:hypothetical protein